MKWELLVSFISDYTQLFDAPYFCELNGCSINRIIEWFGLEGTLKIIWFQTPCHEQGPLPPDQLSSVRIYFKSNLDETRSNLEMKMWSCRKC